MTENTQSPEHVEAPDPKAAPTGAHNAPMGAPASLLTRRELVTFVSAAVSIAVITLALLMARSARSAPEAAAPSAALAERHSSATAPAARSAAPANLATWSSERQSEWTGHRKRSAAFEQPAEEMVSIWLGRVRPILVVRCVDKALQTFVFTGSAIKLEPNTENHTVTFGFDTEPEHTERWPDSEDHDALFAPDGPAFARRLALAHTFRFGYTPHNAAPVVAHFYVSGLGERLEPAATDCGWTR